MVASSVLGVCSDWLSRMVWGMLRMDFGFVLLVILLCCYLTHRRFSQGLIDWPVVGMLPYMIVNAHRLNDWVTESLIQAGGSFRFEGPWLSTMSGVVTCDPLDIEYALKIGFRNFPKGPDFRLIFQDLFGDGIFNSDSDKWWLQRKVSSLEFHSRSFRNFMLSTSQELAEQKLVPILNEASETGSYVDLQDVLLRYTFDAICIGAFGVNPCCLSPGLPKNSFVEAFEVALDATMFRFLLPKTCWQAMRALNLGTERHLRESMKIVDQFALGVISSRRKELDLKAQRGCEDRADLLSRFIRLEHGGEQHGDNFLKDITLSFILAGRDTSAVALAWFFWLLTKHPAVEANIMQEIKNIMKLRHMQSGGACPTGLEGCPFSRDEIQQMNYLHAALSESLRLYPSVPLDIKQVSEKDTLPGGLQLRPGDRLLYSIYSMGRMKSIWGEDCLEFKPDRWLKDGRFVAESPFKFTAFNAGPRLCLGKEVAYLQMKTAVVEILKRFHVKQAPGHVVATKFSIGLYMKDGFLVSLHPRHS
eukprot:c12666_g2_i1 orf=232-1824(-)